MTTKFVATAGGGGSNSNPGTQVSPYLTWAKGLENIVAGDTLYIRGGTYVEGINSTTQTVPSGTSYANAPIIAGYPGETVILAPSGTRPLTLNQDQFQIWKDFIADCTSASDGINLGGNAGARHTNRIRLQGVTVRNLTVLNSSLILTFSNNAAQGFFEFVDCIVHGNNDPGVLGHGLYVNSPSNLVDGLTVYDCNNFGLHVYASGSESTSNVIARRVRSYNNKIGILIAGGNNLLCHSSVSYSNSEDGVMAEFGNACNGTVWGKIVSYGNTGRGFRIGANQSNLQLRNCIARNNGDVAISDIGSGTIQSNNITAVDPLFVNPGAGDFRVQAGSPAIDTGFDQSAYFNTDFAGNVIV